MFTKIKRKNYFHSRFRSNIKEPLHVHFPNRETTKNLPKTIVEKFRVVPGLYLLQPVVFVSNFKLGSIPVIE